MVYYLEGISVALICGGRSMMKQILKFKIKRLEGSHFFKTNLNCLIVVASYNRWEGQQLAYIESDFNLKNFTMASLCR